MDPTESDDPYDDPWFDQFMAENDFLGLRNTRAACLGISYLDCEKAFAKAKDE